MIADWNSERDEGKIETRSKKGNKREKKRKKQMTGNTEKEKSEERR